MNNKRISCIINPVAANSRWNRRKNLKRYLEENIPGPIFDCYQDKAQTIQQAKELSFNNDVLIAAGGDGTVADVMQGIIEAGRGKKTSLAVLPFGGGNAFSRSLDIPLNVRQALRLLETGRTKEIDLIDIEGQVATFASIGATAEITHQKNKKKMPGLRGHLKAGLIIFKLPMRKMQVELFDGLDDSGISFEYRTFSIEALDCIVGKTKHFGYNWRIAPQASEVDGYIDLTFFEITPLKYFLSFPRIYRGTFQKTQKHFKAKKAVFRGAGLHIQYHGEHLGETEKIQMKVLPRSLKVITS